MNDMSLSVLPEDFGLLTNLTSLELRENLIKVKTSFQIEIWNCRICVHLVLLQRCNALFKGLEASAGRTLEAHHIKQRPRPKILSS